jgi:hypothetical protein
MKKEIEILYDHYKETCLNNKDLENKREKLIIYILLILTLFSIQFYSPDQAINAITKAIEYKFGSSFNISFSGFLSLTWGLLTIISIRYFQICIQIERQYSYIHSLEPLIDKEIGGDIFKREGAGYLDRYPKFSNWTWILYTWVFPLGLILIVITKTVLEIKTYSSSYFGLYILNIILSIIITVSSILYLFAIHYKKNSSR